MRVAHTLVKLPRLSDTMRRGEVSYSKVRAVTRVATPENEQALLDVALAGTAAHVEQVVRTWRRIDRAAEAAEDRRRHESRALHTWVDDDGMVVVRGRLTPEVGAVLRRALDAALDAEAGAAPPGAEAADEMAPTIAQRRADALGAVAECALAGGLDKRTAGDRYQVVVHVDADTLADSAEELAADGVATGCPSEFATDVAPDSGDTPAVPCVPAGTHGRGAAAAGTLVEAPPAPAQEASQRRVASNGPGGGQSALEEAGGIHVSAETTRRLACDAAPVTMRHGPAGEVLDGGRRTRTISPALRRALAARDRHCRFPGCRARRCDAHHVRHWVHGGATALDNLVLLCRRHHRAVHEGGFRVLLDAAGEARFARPEGQPLPDAPLSPRVAGEPLAPVTARLERAGGRIGPHTATPAWRGERLDVDWAVSLLWRPRVPARGAAPPA